MIVENVTAHCLLPTAYYLRGGWLAGVAVLLCFNAAAAASPPEEQTKELERMPVTVRVDFGIAGRHGREEHLLIDSGSTPKDAVSLLFPIQSGAICCNTRELAAIDGIWADPAKNRWWSCRVNGSPKISPFRTELKSGDRVEWVYREQAQ